MKVLCILLTFSGAAILLLSIVTYYRVLSFMRGQTYDERIFNNWIYGASFAMMGFFFLGYVVFGVGLFTTPVDMNSLLVALIFFFGALFVLCMVRVQQMMTKTITGKTVETIQSMIDAMEAKDMYTKGHSEHVYKLVDLIYHQLPGEIRQNVNLVRLRDAAMLHDIGKIGIPDGILNKPGKLTSEEYEIIKQHPKNGKAILDKTSYRDIGEWVLYHHERMDGQGYYHIPENAIPIEARIIAVADTFSALYTDRVYRKRFSYADAINILREAAGTQLDPKVVDIFCAIPYEKIQHASDGSASGWQERGERRK